MGKIVLFLMYLLFVGLGSSHLTPVEPIPEPTEIPYPTPTFLPDYPQDHPSYDADGLPYVYWLDDEHKDGLIDKANTIDAMAYQFDYKFFEYPLSTLYNYKAVVGDTLIVREIRWYELDEKKNTYKWYDKPSNNNDLNIATVYCVYNKATQNLNYAIDFGNGTVSVYGKDGWICFEGLMTNYAYEPVNMIHHILQKDAILPSMYKFERSSIVNVDGGYYQVQPGGSWSLMSDLSDENTYVLAMNSKLDPIRLIDQRLMNKLGTLDEVVTNFKDTILCAFENDVVEFYILGKDSSNMFDNIVLPAAFKVVNENNAYEVIQQYNSARDWSDVGLTVFELYEYYYQYMHATN